MTNSENQSPGFIVPQRARLVAIPPSGADWVHEIKLDGYRTQAHLRDGKVRLLTRTGLDWTGRYGTLASAFGKIDARSAIIDGEIITEDERGVSDFSLLQGELSKPRPSRLVFAAFDLLFLDGASWLERPLEARKARLAGLLAASERRLRFMSHVDAPGHVTLAAAARLGAEGIVSKWLHGRYRPGRAEWTKAKIDLRDEFVVVGYVEARAPAGVIGSLLLAFYEDSRLIYAGRVGTGFSTAGARLLWQTLEAIRTKEILLPLPDARPVRWAKPNLVAEVAYAGWTADGLLRHARFKGLRADKPPRLVTRPAVPG